MKITKHDAIRQRFALCAQCLHDKSRQCIEGFQHVQLYRIALVLEGKARANYAFWENMFPTGKTFYLYAETSHSVTQHRNRKRMNVCSFCEYAMEHTVLGQK